MVGKEQVGKFFKDEHGCIWQMISYCAQPSATFQMVGSSQRLGGAVDSMNVIGFKEVEPDQQIIIGQIASQLQKD